MNAYDKHLRERCRTWGGVVVACSIIPEYWGMPQVSVLKIKNARGTHTLILDGLIQTYNNLLDTGLRVRVLEYFGYVFEIQYLSGAVLWKSAWRLDDGHIGYNAHHDVEKCERGLDCAHWIHFYDMTQMERCLFVSLNPLGGFDSYGRHYWHPAILWGGKESWKAAVESPHTVVYIQTDTYYARHLVLPGLDDLKQAWAKDIAKEGAALSTDDFMLWLKSMHLCGTSNGWWRFSPEGTGRSLHEELKRLSIIT